MTESTLYVTHVEAKPSVLSGVIELSWSNPVNPDLQKVVVLRKQNDYPLSEIDPYATVIYEGLDETIYDYCEDGPASTDFEFTAEKVIGKWNRSEQQFIKDYYKPLQDNVLYYYTVFSVDKDGNYHFSNATRAATRTSRYYGTGEKIYNSLPSIYRLRDKDLQLKRFLEGVGMVFDLIMSETEDLSTLVNIDDCPPDKLKYIANLLGWELDDSLPIPSQRQSLKNAVAVYRMAGTRKGLDLLVKLNSGFPQTSGVEEGRNFTLYTVYFGYYPFDLIRYDYEATPNFDTLDPALIGKAGDPLKYTVDFSANNRHETDKFLAYVRKTTPLTPEQEDTIRRRLTRLLDRFSPIGTKYELEIY